MRAPPLWRHGAPPRSSERGLGRLEASPGDMEPAEYFRLLNQVAPPALARFSSFGAIPAKAKAGVFRHDSVRK